MIFVIYGFSYEEVNILSPSLQRSKLRLRDKNTDWALCRTTTSWKSWELQPNKAALCLSPVNTPHTAGPVQVNGDLEAVQGRGGPAWERGQLSRLPVWTSSHIQDLAAPPLEHNLETDSGSHYNTAGQCGGIFQMNIRWGKFRLM